MELGVGCGVKRKAAFEGEQANRGKEREAREMGEVTRRRAAIWSIQGRISMRWVSLNMGYGLHEEIMYTQNAI